MQEDNLSISNLTHSQLLKIDRDYQQAAKIAALKYVTDNIPGIQRIKKGSEFSFLYENKEVYDEKELQRIKKLSIPPAWTEVWICPLPDGHIQATGKDVRLRKQYRYHSFWHTMRTETKFHRLYEF